MSDFPSDWLALREPVDHAARSGALAARFAAALGSSPRIIDFACGTGSNLRYLSPRLGSEQWWLCLDHDASLLAVARDAIETWGAARGLGPAGQGQALLEFQGAQARLKVALIERDLRDPPRAFGVEGCDGITASAFLDLVSAGWLDVFARRVGAARLPVLLALTYDGRMEWSPEQEEDREIALRFNAHQCTDKGFGPALGPDASGYLAGLMEAGGWRVQASVSDWRLEAGHDAPLLNAFIEGVLGAAREVEDDPLLARWAASRARDLSEGRLDLRVGHRDLLALPPD